jgi:hypothetical protein
MPLVLGVGRGWGKFVIELKLGVVPEGKMSNVQHPILNDDVNHAEGGESKSKSKK